MRLVVRALLSLIIISYVASAYAAVTVSVNGVSHTIPQTGEKGWGANVTAWIQAISANTLQPSGGNFTLTADTNFGGTYGLVSSYYKSRSSNISTVGVLRLANTDSIGWRNNANSGNVLLSVDSSDRLLFNGVLLPSLATSDFVDSGFTISDNSDASKKIAFQAAGIGTSTTRTYTGPDASGTLVLADLAQTLTNKTLTITDGLVGTPSLSFASDADTGFYRSTADTLNASAGGVLGLEVKKSTGAYANVGLGGGAASVSDAYPLYLSRALAAGTYFAVENTEGSSSALAALQLRGGIGATLSGQFHLYPVSSPVAAYSARLSMAALGSTTGISLVAAGSGGSDVRFYHNGAASTDESVRFNTDKSMQFMQSISDPSAPASGVLLYGNGTDLRMRGTSGGAKTVLAATIAAKGDLFIGTSANTLGVKSVGADGLFLKADSTQATGVAWASPGGVGIGVTTKAVDYTVTANEDIILCDTSGATRTLTFPAAASNTGKVWRIKKTSASNLCVLDGNASETIDGDATISLVSNGATVELYSDGTNLRINAINDPWRVDINISGANVSLGTVANASYSEMTNGSLTLTQNTGSISSQITCAGTNAPTGTTCAAGNESPGAVFTLPRSTTVRACMSFTHQISNGAGGATNTYFQLVETASNAQTILQEGKDRIGSGYNVASNQHYTPVQVCGTFVMSSVGTKAIRLFFEQEVAGTVTSSQILADAQASSGQRDIHLTIWPLQ